jgi:hypothetical protein
MMHKKGREREGEEEGKKIGIVPYLAKMTRITRAHPNQAVVQLQFHTIFLL